MSLFAANQETVNCKAQLFQRVAFLISFLTITTAGCSGVTVQGNGSPPVSPPDAGPTVGKTPLGGESGGSLEGTPDVGKFTSVFYVSLAGNNTDGSSWATAWSELDEILWDQVKPGSLVLIAGGEYHTIMQVGASGAPGQPITITTNGEQVVLDGQRPPLPYCGQTNYVPAPGKDAIDLRGRSHIVIDGLEWSGIVIRNHGRGINLREGTSDIVVRNVEIHDNGWTRDSGSYIAPDGPGVELGGSDILFERVIIHDNGQDAFQAGWGVWNFTLRDAWLYNSREHPTVRGESFNYCAHTDGIQIYDGGQQGPIVIEDSIIGPSLTQGIIIGTQATVDNGVVRNVLFAGNDNAGIIIMKGGKSSNWTLQNLTIVQDTINKSWNVNMSGTGHRIKDSILWGGSWGIGIFDWTEATGNYHWQTPDRLGVATEVDPRFVDPDYSRFQGKDFADFDFTVQNPAIPSGVGSSITSVADLLDQPAHALGLKATP